MAIIYDQVDFNGVEKDVITVDGTLAGVIFRDSLDPKFDEIHLEKIIASAGADLSAKLAAYTMPNGTTADVYYADFIKVLADYADKVAESKGVQPARIEEFVAGASQTDYAVSHNNKAVVFVDGVEVTFDGSDRSKIVLAAATGGERVNIVVLS